MNELEQIKSQLNEINNKRVRYQTLKEQALAQCKAIEEKYGIKSLAELQALKDKAQTAYDTAVQEAQKYIQDTNRVISEYGGVL